MNTLRSYCSPKSLMEGQGDGSPALHITPSWVIKFWRTFSKRGGQRKRTLGDAYLSSILLGGKRVNLSKHSRTDLWKYITTSLLISNLLLKFPNSNKLRPSIMNSLCGSVKESQPLCQTWWMTSQGWRSTWKLLERRWEKKEIEYRANISPTFSPMTPRRPLRMRGCRP